MKQTVTIYADPFDPESAETFETDDICELLVAHFKGAAPEGLTIWQDQMADDHDVTPLDEADWERLRKEPGKFIVAVRPGGLETALIIAIAVAVLSVVATFLLMPSIPTQGTSQHTKSGNNDLSARQNKDRTLQRIEDIIGTVRATPSLISVPIRLFETEGGKAGQEVEYGDMCVGRGAYSIGDIRDDQTLMSQIKGASVEVYGPNTSAAGGDTPQLTIGDAIAQPMLKVKKSSAANGQTLYASNYKNAVGNHAGGGGIAFQAPNLITSENRDVLRLGDYFDVGDLFTVSNGSWTDGTTTVDFSGGTYAVDAVLDDGKTLRVTAPDGGAADTVDSDWDTITAAPGDTTGYIDASLTSDLTRVAGPFTVTIEAGGSIYINLVASQNLYKVSGTGKQYGVSVDFEVDMTPVDSSGTATGPVQTFTTTMTGSTTEQSFFGQSLKCTPTGSGLFQVSVKRTTDYAYDGFRYSDEVKLRDLYIVAPLSVTDFGNVTTIRYRQVATQTALAIKERKLNCLATRKVYILSAGGVLGGTLTASNNVADILATVATDDYIGRRATSELDGQQIYDEAASIVSYFGSSEAVEFGYTFDDDQTTFEQTAAIIANACFSRVIRRGNLIQLISEQATSDSTLLFNHRNKVPKSETRTASFGNVNDYDGVELTYADSTNYDTPKVYRVPTDGSAVNPKKIEAKGVRNFSQAFWLAWREYYKILNQHVTTEFTAYSEAGTLAIGERILVADNSRPREGSIQDAEVVSQSGLTLTLSQDITFTAGRTYTAHLQVSDGTCDNIAVTAGAAANQVVLASSPSGALSTDETNYRKATIWIVDDSDTRAQAFLVSEINPQGGRPPKFAVSAVEYRSEYYAKDSVTPS